MRYVPDLELLSFVHKCLLWFFFLSLYFFSKQIKKLKELRAMVMEQDPDVAVTIRKLAVVSLMELFKDITPSYKIRPLTEAEKSIKVISQNDYYTKLKILES